MSTSAVVLGAGLQGSLVALALARAGFTVTLVDEAPGCMLRASLTNEGKIHLGFVYAHDRSQRTAALMLEAALVFEPLLDDWLGGPLDWPSLVADPFSYVVLNDSLVPPGELERSWYELQERYENGWPRGTGRYLGARPRRLWQASTPAVRAWLSDRAVHVVDTAERSVRLPALRALVDARLAAEPRVHARYDHRVRAVQRTSNGFVVDGESLHGCWRVDAPVVINCLWHGRLAIDREMGILPSRPWVYRLKYRLLGRLPDRLAALPSLTMMLGRYGDIVNYGDGRVYLSWYPTCLGGWSSDVDVPDAWRQPCADGLALADARHIIEPSLAAFDDIVPGLGACRIDSVAAGVIFSWGATDIDDLGSELHQRYDIGPGAHDGYITVNTGKLTSAPLFAQQVAALLR